jgi:hypothetical protein
MRKLMQLLLFFPIVSWAQLEEVPSSETVLKDFSELSKVYSKGDYSLSFQRVIYRNLEDKQPMMTENGKIYRGVKSEYRVEIPGSLTIQNHAMKVVVDSTLKVISVLKTDTLFEAVDLKKFMDQHVSDQYSFKRSSKSGVLHYSITPKRAGESITDVWINESGHTLQRIELIMPKANYFSEQLDDESEETPKLVITYGKPVMLGSNKAAFFELGGILTDSSENLSLNPKVIGFTLHDTRINTK